MDINKAFNEWISKNFRGLSTHTLCQFLFMEDGLYDNIVNINNLVYATLYEYFVGNHDDKHTDTFEYCKMLVENCAWL